MIMESSLKKNDLIQIDNGIFRVLEVNCDKALLIDCVKRTMPGWKAIKDIVGFSFCDEDELHRKTGYRPAAIEECDTFLSSCLPTRRRRYKGGK